MAAFWLVLGFFGQALFSSRFIIQWLMSEKARRSVVPTVFWWLSIGGSMALLAYAIHKRDPVIIVGQATGLIVYARNLLLIRESRRTAGDDLPAIK
jgi:lipid-A-disaccharide synthase-like uncharacterized protein